MTDFTGHTHRVTVRVPYHNRSESFHVEAKSLAEALVKAKLHMNEHFGPAWEVHMVVEFAPRNIPGGKAKIVFNADLIEEDASAAPE